MKNSQNIKDEFFIIESDNLEDVNTRLYGYTIMEDDIQTQKEFTKNNTLTGNGAYVDVTSDSEEIIISQDAMGSYGIYIYKYDDYFALSNSFIKLVEFIKEKQVLTLNEAYSKTFLSSKINVSFDETLINEITLIPKDYKIIIDKNNKKIQYEKTNLQEKTLKLNTKEAMDCLDTWFNKWISILRNLTKQKRSLTIKLDGTIASRIILSILLNSNINIKNINLINKADDEKNNTILMKLKEISNITITKQEKKENIQDIGKSMDNSYYAKLGFNKQISLENISDETHYILEDKDIFDNIFKNKSLEDILKAYTDEAKYYSKEYAQIVENYLWNNLHKLQKHVKNYDIYSGKFLESAYQHMILRNTTGKETLEKYLSNRIMLNPLLDTQLQSLTINDEKQDLQQILYTTILSRYNPELLNIEFTDQSIDQENRDYTNNINTQYPYKKPEYELIESPQKYTKHPDTSEDKHEYNTLIRKIFFSNPFKHNFLKYYPSQVYGQITKKYMEKNNHSTHELNAAIAIVKILNDIEYSQNNTFNTELNWLETYITQDPINQSSPVINHLLNKYNTARIDMKNQGTPSNQIKILDISDETSKITKPSWFTNEKGEGICVSSDKSELFIKIKCINDGKLKLDLRTLDIRDRVNKRFPVYIDYLNFKVDNQELLKENKLIWHDKPIHYTRKVINNEIITIYIKWKPFSNMSKIET